MNGKKSSPIGDSIQVIAGTRDRRLGESPPAHTPEEKETRLRQYHPDFVEENFAL